MKRVVLLVAVIVLAAVLGLGLLSYVQAGTQLPALRNEPTYASPEDGMKAMIPHWCEGIERAEVIQSGPDSALLSNLWFVKARVWATRRWQGCNGRRQPRLLLPSLRAGLGFCSRRTASGTGRSGCASVRRGRVLVA